MCICGSYYYVYTFSPYGLYIGLQVIVVEWPLNNGTIYDKAT